MRVRLLDGKFRSTRGAKSPANRLESPLVLIDADRDESWQKEDRHQG
jgi:hypothetical protein